MQNDSSSLVRAKIVYFSHGGPLPLLGDASHEAMVDFMTDLPDRLRKPDAIVVISAHWEESAATLLSGSAPPPFYEYSCPGSPELASRISEILSKQNITSRLNPKRGFDHGLFIPLKMMYPEAAPARFQRPNASNAWSNGTRHPLPATAIPARSIYCLSMFVLV